MANLDQLGMRLSEDQRSGFRIPNRATSQLPRFMEIVAQVQAWRESVAKREFAIANNTKLSDVGKREALAKLAGEALQELKFLGDKLAQIIEAQHRLRELVLDYMDRPKGADALVLYFRERELRDGFRDRPQADRDVAFLKAAQRLDAETLRSMLDAPGKEPWITADIRSRGDVAYGERKNPEAWLRIQDLDVLREHVQGIADHAGQVLLTMGADPVKIKEVLGSPAEEAAHA